MEDLSTNGGLDACVDLDLVVLLVFDLEREKEIGTKVSVELFEGDIFSACLESDFGWADVDLREESELFGECACKFFGIGGEVWGCA